MKIGYRDFWLEIDIIGTIKKILSRVPDFYNERGANKEKVYPIAIVIEETLFVRQVGKIKVSLSHISDYIDIDKLMVAPYNGFLIQSIFKDKYIKEYSEEFGWDEFTYEDIKEDFIIIMI